MPASLTPYQRYHIVTIIITVIFEVLMYTCFVDFINRGVLTLVSEICHY